MTNSAVEIQCLGDFAIQGLAVDLRGTKQVALLGFLASNLGMPCARETLVSIFWGDRFNEQARQSLRQALSALRRAFRHCPDGLEIERDIVRLNPAVVSVDIKQAETAIANGNMEKAAEIFRRGDFLEALNPKESGISDWLVLERAKWRELARQTLLDHGEALLRQTQPIAAAETAAWLLRQDPLDETAVQLAMRSKATAGSLSGAVKLYRRLCDDLQSELGVEPAAETVDCISRLQQGVGVRQQTPAIPAAGETAFEGVGSSSPKNLSSPVIGHPWRPEAENIAAASDVPTISVDRFDFAPDDATTKAMAADLRDQLIFRLTKRIGIKVLDEHAGLTDKSTYVLKGRLRTSDNQGRLNLSMILREQSRAVFSQNYTGDTSDTFKFCDDMVGQAETHLRVQTNAFDGERLSHIPDDELSVPELRTRAANLLHAGTIEGFGHAEQLMDRAVELDLTDPTSLAMRANIKIWLSMAGCRDLSVGEQDQIGADLNTALEGQHRSDYIYHVRGTFFACCKQDAEATLRDGQRALEINPNYALAYNTLGLGHLLLGQYDKAAAFLRKYVALSENDPLLPARLFPLAVALYCNGDYQDAEKTIDRAIGLKPNHRLFHRLRAMSLRAIGYDDEADAADLTADQLPNTPSMLAVCPPIHQDQSDHFSSTMR